MYILSHFKRVTHLIKCHIFLLNFCVVRHACRTYCFRHIGRTNFYLINGSFTHVLLVQSSSPGFPNGKIIDHLLYCFRPLPCIQYVYRIYIYKVDSSMDQILTCIYHKTSLNIPTAVPLFLNFC